MLNVRKISNLITDNAFGVSGLINIQIKNGRIKAISNIREEDLLQLDLESTNVFDARQMLVLPGLIDSHVHIIGSSLYFLSADLSSVRNLDDLKSRLESCERASGNLIVAGRFNIASLSEDEREAFASFIDDAIGEPVYIRSVEHHSAFVNSKAWELLGIDKLADALGVSRDEVLKMKRRCRIWGKLFERVGEKVYNIFGYEEKKDALKKFLKKLPRVGIVCVHCLEGYGSNPKEDFEVIDDVNLSCCEVDLILYPRTFDVRLAKELGLGRMGGCILIDGAVGARTAAFNSPYKDEPTNFGSLYLENEELDMLVESALSEGIQLAVHAIGDKAIEQVVASYERLAGKYDIASVRPRIEHLTGITGALADRCAKLGLVSSMQPSFDYFFGGKQGAYAQALGSKRALQMNPLRTVYDSGMIFGGGSDSPITVLNPLLGIFAGVNHHNPEQRLSLNEAFGIFTKGSAMLAKQEQERGQIKPAMLADFTILPRDAFGLNPENIEPIATIKQGIITFQNPRWR